MTDQVSPSTFPHLNVELDKALRVFAHSGLEVPLLKCLDEFAARMRPYEQIEALLSPYRGLTALTRQQRAFELPRPAPRDLISSRMSAHIENTIARREWADALEEQI